MIGWLLWMACSSDPKVEDAKGAAKHPYFPFPSMHHMDDGHVALPDDLPFSTDGTPIEPARLAWRTGFSVVQSAVVSMDVAADATSLPAQSNPTTDGSVQLWDLTTQEPVLCFAELDAAEPIADEYPALLVRPRDILIPGHRMAVVLTDQIQTTDGSPMPIVDWYRDLQDGVPGPGLHDWVDHYQDLHSALDGLGVEGITLAFDFLVDDGGAPVRHVAENVGIPVSYSFDEVRSTDDGIIMPDGGWRQLRGRYAVDNWLVEDLYFSLDGSGIPEPQGTAQAELYVYMPDSVRDAEPGTVPVWIFGHGLFGEPDFYLGDIDDPSKVAKLASEAGAIVFATVWRGFKASDRIHAIQIADDFGRVHEITERLTQGVANVVALSRLITEGDVLDDPALLGLPDTSGELRYYGISLGGIAGAVTLANNPRITHGVFNVGGGAWSTMLERSSQWIPFDWIMVEKVPSNQDRQLLYALSQLYWDPVDPMNHVTNLIGQDLVWQEAIGDEQVANMTTRMLVRGVGATQLEPMVESVAGIASEEGPLAGPGYVQFDPELPLPAEVNRPGVPSGAHSKPRTWPGSRQQVAHFLDWDAPGELLHFCGEAVCSASNPGE